MNSSPGIVATPGPLDAAPDAVESTLAGDDQPLGRVAQHRVRGRLVGAPRTRPARPALLLPDDLTAQQQPQVVLQDGGDVGGQAAVRTPAEVGDVHRDATTRLERADALAQHVTQHGEVVDVVTRYVALAERRLVLLAGEVRRRGDDEGDRRVGHPRHVAGVTDVDDIELTWFAERIVVADLGRGEARRRSRWSRATRACRHRTTTWTYPSTCGQLPMFNVGLTPAAARCIRSTGPWRISSWVRIQNWPALIAATT